MDRERLKELVTAECRRLAKLGSAEAIADELSARSMRGYVDDQEDCPLARGISDTLMIDTGLLHVHAYGITAGKRGNPPILAEFREELAPLQTFVWNFDAGKYPHLVA